MDMFLQNSRSRYAHCFPIWFQFQTQFSNNSHKIKREISQNVTPHCYAVWKWKPTCATLDNSVVPRVREIAGLRPVIPRLLKTFNSMRTMGLSDEILNRHHVHFVFLCVRLSLPHLTWTYGSTDIRSSIEQLVTNDYNCLDTLLPNWLEKGKVFYFL